VSLRLAHTNCFPLIALQHGDGHWRGCALVGRDSKVTPLDSSFPLTNVASLHAPTTFYASPHWDRVGQLPYWTLMHHMNLPQNDFAMRLIRQVILGKKKGTLFAVLEYV
jgi:hypothetical protein